MTQPPIAWDVLFTNLPAACVVMDRDLRIVTATDLYLETVGRRLDDIQGQHVFEAFPEEGERLEMFGAAFRKALSGESSTLIDVPYAIPIYDEDGHDTGTRKEIWWNCQHNPVPAADGSIPYVIQKAQDVTGKVMAERLKDAVMREMQHRIGNIFALVSATAKRTVASSTDFDDFLPKFEGRMMALARTHTYLTGDHWDDISIEKIVSRELADYNDLDESQITIEGTNIVVNAAEAQILTLAVHELTTNAIKHGALKSRDGRLTVKWVPRGKDGYHFDWRESGIMIEATPERRGFGSFILDSVVPTQLSGAATREFLTGGFVYQVMVDQRLTSA
ncbi:HWE histidine kinase domain-containing protein [Loktanella sp. DJP18]|uniref:HWE histidine kinase domain-containing protein n=1 Tax=Loktanella sp. DJP18 TaxID=3409788 RepID=UPI003BB7D34B